jgi:hypothetical protein
MESFAAMVVLCVGAQSYTGGQARFFSAITCICLCSKYYAIN